MKKIICALICLMMLAGCGAKEMTPEEKTAYYNEHLKEIKAPENPFIEVSTVENDVKVDIAIGNDANFNYYKMGVGENSFELYTQKTDGKTYLKSIIDGDTSYAVGNGNSSPSDTIDSYLPSNETYTKAEYIETVTEGDAKYDVVKVTFTKDSKENTCKLYVDQNMTIHSVSGVDNNDDQLVKVSSKELVLEDNLKNAEVLSDEEFAFAMIGVTFGVMASTINFDDLDLSDLD